ncbi:MAG: hypothetical protein JRE23_09745, partial [Deltaproteobacteria bacterium]|nr:hypothetical protein [Deltaproteobacteria bacterium]
MIRKLSPPQLLVIAFLFLILLGSFILKLPGTTTSGHISYVDALFTSTSAVCVTGLVVKDTGADFTVLGQVILIVLIQLGGLGIMTFSTILLYLLGRQPTLREQSILQDTFSHSPVRDVHRLVLLIVVFTLLVELIGAIAYFTHWIREFPLGKALFFSLFHSISAFCNAGFCLFSDSFAGYRANGIINANTIVLIITGGIGFLVLLELYERYVVRKRPHEKPLSLHTKLTLITTAVLIIAGSAFFFFVEHGQILGDVSPSHSIFISLFQSVTARTAGFNTVDFSLLSNSTLFFFIILMFIGASPGSCGGGVKTTTVAVFFAVVRSRLRGEEYVRIMNRSIPNQSVARTVSVIISAVLVIVVMTIALLLTQAGSAPYAESRGMFLEYLFEAVS